ncbi:right-handed parallel beta-helix repeat-containing protein [Bacillus pumilus]|uniref:right-handed parallel beta-helix repeat-containing protein n=1 Tax=Bacillus pumilus TaxID=1408 RepID=UPI0011A2C0DC|nr:right-handed parallel beta-helix repeat-containing protein [Bacillus pumilus]
MALENDLIPVNTLGVQDEETGKWIPVDAVALRSHTDRYTIDDIKKMDTDLKTSMNDIKRSNSDLLNTFNVFKKDTQDQFSSIYKKFPFKNAIDYGADPTGKKPSAAYIQSALNAIHSDGGGWLIIPDGEYLIEKRMYIYENTRITMGNNCRLIRGWAGGFFSNGLPNDRFKGYNGRGNIHIEGGKLDGNYLKIESYPTTAMDSIILGHARNITVDGVTFVDTITAHAIDANGCDNLNITKCRFEGFIDLSGNRPYSEAIQLGEFTEAGLDQFGEWDSTPNINVYIAHNYFGKSNKLGGWGSGVGNHYTIYNVFQTDITIFDNDFEDCGFAGVRTYKWGNVKILNNRFKRNQDCIRISQAAGGFESSKTADGVQTNRPQSAQNILIQGNDFLDYIAYGVLSYGQIANNEVAWSEGIKIKDNTFKLKKKSIGDFELEQAVKLVFAKNVNISGNDINGGRRGFWIEGCSNVSVDDNEVINVATEGVFIEKSGDTTSTVSKSNYISVCRNRINSVGRNGIYAQNCDYFDINDNTVIDSNLENDPKNSRGGIYVESGNSGKVENNRIYGNKKEFAILIDSGATDVNVSNTKGTGRVIALGTNFNGYYGTSSDDTIRKIITKAN